MKPQSGNGEPHRARGTGKEAPAALSASRSVSAGLRKTSPDAFGMTFLIAKSRANALNAGTTQDWLDEKFSRRSKSPAGTARSTRIKNGFHQGRLVRERGSAPMFLSIFIGGRAVYADIFVYFMPIENEYFFQSPLRIDRNI